MAREKPKPKKTEDAEPKHAVVRGDVVDATRGIWPFGTKHPEGAVLRQAGELGGSSYDESGRSGLDMSADPARWRGIPAEELAEVDAFSAHTEPRTSEPDLRETKGVLSPHRDSRSSKEPPRRDSHA